ncbi:MAG: hypothetical protein VXZ92_10770, partial [SAR324 cluster bacterium]|nr:hypothetical protein [SAR324 cluster bacterium]
MTRIFSITVTVQVFQKGLRIGKFAAEISPAGFGRRMPRAKPNHQRISTLESIATSQRIQSISV